MSFAVSLGTTVIPTLPQFHCAINLVFNSASEKRLVILYCKHPADVGTVDSKEVLVIGFFFNSSNE